MKEWIEELLKEKASAEQYMDLLVRVISYVDENHDDADPISIEVLQNVAPLRVSVDQEGVHLNYVSPING